MKVEINIQNPNDQAALTAIAQTNGASVEDVTRHIVHGALEEREAKLADITKALEREDYYTDEEVAAFLED